MFQNFMSLTYLGKVGFRPWVAARNMIQPYQMLAPRIGLAPVHEAMKEILGPKGRDIMLRMRDEGTLMQDVPTAAPIGEGKIAKITRTSMQQIFKSDDVTRAVSARAAENLIDEGIRSWNAGKFRGDVKKFQDFSELRSIRGTSPDLVTEITAQATSGDPLRIKQAKVLFGQKLATEIQPDYGSWAQPHLFTNTLPGNLFGRFGVYSAVYRENIYRGWQNGQGLAGKALFAGRFIGIGLAISAALGEGLMINGQTVIPGMGIQGKDFLPGYGGLFGGGPQFTEAIALAQSMSTGPNGETSRLALEKMVSPIVINEKNGNLAANYPSMLPGSMQLHYLNQFTDAVKQGDYWKAFLAATTVPVIK
jgi:hypothetical protein